MRDNRIKTTDQARAVEVAQWLAQAAASALDVREDEVSGVIGAGIAGREAETLSLVTPRRLLLG